jgi:hypothetical protein
MSFPYSVLGTTREHYLLLFGAASVVGLFSGLLGAWIGGYLGARRAVRTAQLNANPERLTAQQMEPIMGALDAIAVEVERISEAQRFTTRVLSDRPAVMLPRSESRSITPH